MEKRIEYQYVFDVQHTSVIEHMVYASDSAEARMNILGKDFQAFFGDSFNWRNPILIFMVLTASVLKYRPF